MQFVKPEKKPMKALVLFAAAALLIISCSRQTLTDCNGRPGSDSARVTIEKDGSATVFDCSSKKFVIQFVKVNDDSRCPTQLLCVWAGAAGISISINDDKNLIPLRLDSTSAISVNQDNYNLKFEKLDPYPTTTPTNSADYKATLFLWRK
jgi:hypothetical protein